MKRSNRLLILVGVFLAVIAMLLVVVVGGNGNGNGTTPSTATASPTATAEPTVLVVVAKTDIAFGQKITQDMVDTTTMTVSQRDKLGPDTFDSVGLVIGKIAGATIQKGQPLLAGSDFLNAGSVAQGQDMASAIGQGKVAMTLEVDQINGVGGLVVPGDHVDLILSIWVDQLSITNDNASSKWKITMPGGTQVTTKMVIQNCKVLATLLPAAAPNANAPAPAAVAGASPSPTPGPSAELVTNSGNHMIVVLEVLPSDAEVIRWAQREEAQGGQNYLTLGLDLRSDKDYDTPPVTTPGITFKQMVTIYGVLPPDPRAIIPADLAKQISW